MSDEGYRCKSKYYSLMAKAFTRQGRVMIIDDTTRLVALHLASAFLSSKDVLF